MKKNKNPNRSKLQGIFNLSRSSKHNSMPLRAARYQAQERNELLFLVLLAVFFSFTSFILSLLPLQNTGIHGGATSETVSLSLTISAEETNLSVPASGTIVPSNAYVLERVTQVTGLTQGWGVNVTLFGTGFPSSWTETQPNSNQIGNNIIEYMEIGMNASTDGGSYRIYFNATSSQLAGVHPKNISLLVFDTAWTNLTTVVVNSNTDPRQFYGVTSHFSKFLIAQKPASSTEGSGESSGGSDSGSGGGSSGSGGGGGGGGSSGRKKAVEEVEEDEEEEEEIETPIKPIHKPSDLFDVSIEIPEKYREVLPGETVIGEISLINIEKIGLVSVQVEYQLQDREENILSNSSETKAVENEITYIKELELPEDIEPGDYIFFIQVDYEGDIATAGYPFKVLGEEPFVGGAFAQRLKEHLVNYSFYWIIGTAVIILLTLAMLFLRKRKERYPHLTFLRRE